MLEALRSGREVDRLLVQEGAEGSIGKILSLAKERKVPVSFAKKTLLDQKARGSSHQGVIAYVSAYRYASLDEVFRLAESRGEAPFLILLDEVEDPHNLGAIMRTAECAGAHGVVITKRRASGLTETVAKASAGAVVCAFGSTAFRARASLSARTSSVSSMFRRFAIFLSSLTISLPASSMTRRSEAM